MHSAYVGLQSRSPVVHDNALEFVENVLRPTLRELLIPLLDSDVTVDQRVQIADHVTGLPLTSAEDAVRVLMASDDAWLQSCAAYVAGQLGLESLMPQIAQWAEDPNPLLRETAREAKARLARA
jgi:hypothetical protein